MNPKRFGYFGSSRQDRSMNRKPRKPMAGCGPYLMFEPEEKKMSGETNYGVMGALINQIKTPEEWERELSGVKSLAKAQSLPSQRIIFSDSAMTISDALSQREKSALLQQMASQMSQQEAQQQLNKQQASWAQVNQPAMIGHNSGPNTLQPGPGQWTPAEPEYAHTMWPFPAPGDSFFVRLERTDYNKAIEVSRRRAERVSELTHRLGMLEEILQRYERVAAEEAPGDHIYNGPVENGKTVPDTVHERFHKAIGDVMAGKVMHEARKQMQESLKNAPKEKTPFPTGVDHSDHRRIGWRSAP
jgi:hypothetical protein